MKIIVLPVLLLLLAVSASAQPVKGALPLTQNAAPNTQNSTWAVVVGISDYKATEIPDLYFADRDAEQFAAWLKSPAGGSVPNENIFLLTNEKATNSAIGLLLYELLGLCKAGDMAIFYFSGHGDLETKIRNQPGFLLAHDSPSKAYATNALDLRQLGDIVSTLLDQQVRVVLVTDACHSGKLAGSDTGGSQATALALQKQFANTVKIMSCQPNEYSIEGEQWDGGRGVFSYHLVEGLTGLADRDTNSAVTLFEIRRYLEDRVPADAAPHPQMPLTDGDLNFRLARVDADALAALRHRKADKKETRLDGIVTKGLEEQVLARADTLTRARYRAFQRALADHNLLTPSDSSADVLFGHLIATEVLRPLHGVLRRNYAVALLDEVQQALNALLDNDPYEANAWNFNPAKYAEYPRYLQRSIELLGENHYMYSTLLAKKYYFEGYNIAKNIGNLENDPVRRDSCKVAAKAKFLEAIQAEPEAAYPYYAIGDLYYYNAPSRVDSLEWWCSQAIDLSPNWLAPYLLISYEYGATLCRVEPAEMWLRKALARHPKSYLALERLSWLKQWQGKADESIAISQEMIAMKPDIFNAYSTLSVTLTQMKGEYLESEKYCLKSLAINPNQGWWAQTNLLRNYLRTRRAAQAVEVGTNWLNTDNTYSSSDKACIATMVLYGLVELGKYDEAAYWLNAAKTGQWGDPSQHTYTALVAGRIHLLQGDLKKAEQTLLHALTIDVSPNESWPVIYALLGDVKALENKPAEAESYYIKGVTNSGFLGHFFRDEAMFRYGRFLLAQKRPAEAEAQFREIGRILPKSYFLGYGMALLAATRGQQQEALDGLEKSLDNFWPEAGSIQAEPLFKKIRKTKRFRELMAKHFPETTKQ